MPRVSGTGPVVLFDGYCKLCSGFAVWALERDRAEKLLFAPIQGETAKKLLTGLGCHSPPAKSVIFLHDGVLDLRSTAVLKILRLLGPPWSRLYPLIAIPRPIRDLCYRLVARVRYRIFGRRDSCRAPGPDQRGRMLP